MQRRSITALVASMACVAALLVAAPAYADPGTVVATAPIFDDVESTVEIPSIEGVDYSLEGQPVDAGIIPVEEPIATVVADAQEGYTLEGASGWSHPFSVADVVISALAPTITDEPGGGSIDLPASDDYSWLVNGVAAQGPVLASGAVLLVAVAGSGFVIDGAYRWSHTFPVTPVVATDPTFTDAFGTSSDSYTIPAVQGVEYSVGGVPVAAGTYVVDPLASVTIDAVSTPGYELTGTASWSYTYSDLLGTFTSIATPGVTGDAVVGQTLTAATDDTFDPQPAAFEYQWFVGEVEIADATSASYTVRPGDLGSTIWVLVTATAPDYEPLAVQSTPSAEVAAAPFDSAPAPVITGTPRVGDTLGIDPLTWSPDATFTYQWNADTLPIEGATGTTYVPTPEQLGALITVTVTGSALGYVTTVVTSAPTTAVARAPFTSSAAPTISGTPKVGVTLTAAIVPWSPDATFTYQWNADGVPIAGATSTTFVPGPDQVGAAITVTVTGSATGYVTTALTSMATAPVALGTFETRSATITGTVQVGKVLTASVEAWDPAATLTYQWRANGVAISGATATTFTLTPSQVDKTISVAVSGTAPGYADALALSATTAAVAKGVFAAATPVISGTAKVNSTLTATVGSWSPGPSFTYQWYANDVAISGATALTYQVAPTLSGKVITFAATGSTAGYVVTTRTSAATSAVAKTTFVSTATPTITGSPVVGGQLTVVPNTSAWSPSATPTAYRWMADGVTIGAVSGTLNVTNSMAGARITVEVTAATAGYEAKKTTSAETAYVTGGQFTSTPTPTITGTPKRGSTLTAVTDAWAPNATLSYQWYAGTALIPGATSSTFVPTTAEVGFPIKVRVTASNPAITSQFRTSASTSAVAGAFTAPTPSVSGTATVGSLLTAVPGTWTPTPSFSYQWYANGVAITNAQSTTYRLTAAEIGKKLTVKVTGSKTSYPTTAKLSAATATVLGVFAAPTPVISGTARVGQTLLASAGAWTPAGTRTFQWYASGVAISGATSSTLKLAAAQAGKTITVKVTGKKTNYVTLTKTSASTSAVASGLFTTAPVPTITGTIAKGQTVTAAVGKWTPTPSFTYQWFINGVGVPGAVNKTFTIPASTATNAKLTVRVSAKLTGYSTTSKTSTPYAVR